MYFTAKDKQPEGSSATRMRLMREELRKFGLLESYRPRSGSPSTSIYYGMNISRGKEPLDQVDVLLLASRLKRAGLEPRLMVFVAGRYGQLNGRPADGIVEAEMKKGSLVVEGMKALGLYPITREPIAPCMGREVAEPVTLTDALWNNPAYWEAVDELKDAEGIIDRSRNGPSFREVASTFEPEIRQCMPGGLLAALERESGPSLYRLFEVAEAKVFRDILGMYAKIGPAFEEEYDIFIGQFMDIIQLRQPLDFRSRPGCLKPVTPYIGKEGEQRIFLEDGKDEIALKVAKLAQRAGGQPLYCEGYLNPFVRTAILATEAAAAQESAPVSFGTRRVFDGGSVLDFFEKAGTKGFQKYASAVVECLWAYLVQPMQRKMAEKEVAAA